MQKMKIFFIFTLCLLTHCSTTKIQSFTEGGLVNGVYQIEAKKYTLPNGLTVILSKNTKLPVFSIYSFYKVGSKDEPKGMTGASHFLEHMMFKGAKKYGLGEFDKIIEANGGFSNAYTNYDQTVYYEKMPAAALENILDLESDRMQNLLLETKGFLSEKQVVLEERKMRYENSPNGQRYVTYMNKLLKGTPYEHPVIGTVKDVKTVSRDDVFKYFKNYYAPNNAVLVIVGDINYAKTLSLVKDKFAHIPASKLISEKERNKEYSIKLSKNTVEHYHGKSENPLFVLAFPGVRYGTRAGYVGDLLGSILGGSKSSFLNQKYVSTKSPLLNSIVAFNHTIQNAGVFSIQGEILKPIGLNNFKNRLLKDFKTFCANEITPRNLQKVKNQYLLDFYRGLETNAGVADYLGTVELYKGDFSKYVEELKIYQTISLDEVKTGCHDFLLTKNHYFMTVWKKNKKKFDI